ncbi:MAG: hypothetical protein RQ993_03100 [Bacteroidota bacterium]|nr:hypothetical protein [Bacteroidota bacterium]
MKRGWPPPAEGGRRPHKTPPTRIQIKTSARNFHPLLFIHHPAHPLFRSW